MAPLMAKTPETAIAFLEELGNNVKEKANKEIGILEELKRQYEGVQGGPIRPWDCPFYSGLAKAKAHNLDARVVSQYFPLQRCVAGLQRVTQMLFGVRMQQAEPQEGETWAPEVHKYTLTHQTEGPLGHIYLDLLPRPSKYSHAAHFTLRCGRNLSDSHYQLPVVALVCSFPQARGTGSCFLAHHDVETLFHEFGHALHSLLSRTEYQHLSGTRAALDFVETPSNLFEYFASDFRVLREFACQPGSSADVIIPQAMVESLRDAKRMFAARDVQNQVIYSLSDLALFGRQPIKGDGKSVLSEIQNRFSAVKHVEGTHWETRFSHLITYGAGYYSYLYAKCFAAEIWNRHFSEDPLNPEAGDELRQKLLCFGGSRDPTEILEDVVPGAVLRKNGVRGIQPCSRLLLKEVGV